VRKAALYPDPSLQVANAKHVGEAAQMLAKALSRADSETIKRLAQQLIKNGGVKALHQKPGAI